jgi:hypothetical protein
MPWYSYFTESRVVNLYVPSGPSTQAPQSPPSGSDQITVNGFTAQALWPQTQVFSDLDVDRQNVVEHPFVWVVVPSNPSSKGWVLRKFLRKCSKMGQAAPSTGQVLTGVTYGDYKYGSDARGKEATNELNPLGGMRFVAKGERCAVCGNISRDHRIYETEALRQQAMLVAKRQIQAARGSNRMVGLFEVRPKGLPAITLMAESGFEEDFRKTAEEFEYIYVSIKDLTDKPYLNCLPKPIQTSAGKNTYTIINQKAAKEETIKCAAPKLVQYYIHYLLKSLSTHTVYMSEVFCTGKDLWDKKSKVNPVQPPGKPSDPALYPADATAESCQMCRRNIPRMLCGHINIDTGIGSRTRIH